MRATRQGSFESLEAAGGWSGNGITRVPTAAQQAARKAKLDKAVKLEREAEKLREEAEDRMSGTGGGSSSRYARVTDDWGNVWWKDTWRDGWGVEQGTW